MPTPRLGGHAALLFFGDAELYNGDSGGGNGDHE
jgi:hypothetical protein